MEKEWEGNGVSLIWIAIRKGGNGRGEDWRYKTLHNCSFQLGKSSFFLLLHFLSLSLFSFLKLIQTCRSIKGNLTTYIELNDSKTQPLHSIMICQENHCKMDETPNLANRIALIMI